MAYYAVYWWYFIIVYVKFSGFFCLEAGLENISGRKRGSKLLNFTALIVIIRLYEIAPNHNLFCVNHIALCSEVKFEFLAKFNWKLIPFLISWFSYRQPILRNNGCILKNLFFKKIYIIKLVINSVHSRSRIFTVSVNGWMDWNTIPKFSLHCLHYNKGKFKIRLLNAFPYS